MSEITNENLKLEEIPKRIEDGGMYFALSFNGYESAGSTDSCFATANKIIDSIRNENTSEITLSELRTTLFAHARSLHFSSADPDKELVDKLLTLIRQRVKENRLK
ncbi:hypothetical protein QWY85_15365 [Neolewinella lacunae]|uniref:Uncharacterized protein n=1 Tax=Neolewinella lacunae TaxID=1517758 RepID=A0A923PMS6_9BACT|nr:hypothetical protein [Neolewinella lacunae]MBC6994083.1 hypothetical protein [Neolewinella lacunae]MDN3636046.1 hypothetical protein [Neolewinella lacunae]